MSRLHAQSPRRRAFLLGLIGLIVVGIGAVALVFVPRLVHDAGRTMPAQDQLGPVLLVPGYGGGTGAVEALAVRLRAAGRPAQVVGLPGDGTGNLSEQAATLDRAVTAALDAGAPSVDLVGYSAGGVVVRLWLQEYDGVVKARRIVTLGSPHHGTGLAATAEVVVPGACPVACQQLVPGSSLLQGLAEPVPTPPSWLALWTNQDTTVTPPESGRLAGATNVELQAVCPALVVDHSGLPADPVVIALVLAAIGPAPVRPPTAAVCASS